MTTIKHTLSFSGWIALQLSWVTLLLKPRYMATDMAAMVARSGNPAGA
jgi:hypothetical protein